MGFRFKAWLNLYIRLKRNFPGWDDYKLFPKWMNQQSGVLGRWQFRNLTVKFVSESI